MRTGSSPGRDGGSRSGRRAWAGPLAYPGPGDERAPRRAVPGRAVPGGAVAGRAACPGRGAGPARPPPPRPPRRQGPRPASSSPVSPRRWPGPRTGWPPGPPACRRSATPSSCRSASAATTSWPRSATHQVVVVAGETGSGKTTQLPKMCLELGRGVKGLVGHTQPRRIAARAVAERIAEEVGSPLGEDVGYVVRFHDQISDASYVKVMTDGILLAEIQSDRLLSRYDTLIIDEAHERSLNIDFLLGYLKQLLPRRPDLKIVITSATIDPQRFADHFDGAPVVEVSRPDLPGRGPLPAAGRPRRRPGAGDLRRRRRAVGRGAGRRAGLPVRRAGDPRRRRGAARLDAGRHRGAAAVRPAVGRRAAPGLQPRQGRRRVVLATNVAETSLTVPGIRYVVDPGTARISRYSQRTKVQRLPIEAISQASATPARRPLRARRGGHLHPAVRRGGLRGPPGVHRPGDPAHQPGQRDPADDRARARRHRGVPVRRAAGDAQHPRRRAAARRARRPRRRASSTPVGRQLAQLPVDPRLGRMVVEADRNGVLHEVLVAGGGAVDPGPARAAAGRAAAGRARCTPGSPTRRRTSSPTSTCGTTSRPQQRALGRRRSGGCARQEYLNHLRVREWQDVHNQLRQVTRTLGLTHETPHPDDVVDADKVHQSLLAGLLSQVGLRDVEKREYVGARGARFDVVPGSRAVQEDAALGRRRRARRDQPAVGAGRGPGPAGVGRGARRPPRRAHVRRAALGPRAGGGDRVRAGHPVRAAAGRPGARSTTGGSTPRPPATCSCARRSSRATGTRTTPSSPRTAGCSRTSRSSSTGPAGATSSSTTRRCTTSTTRGSPRTWCPAGTSTPGGRRPGRSSRTC